MIFCNMAAYEEVVCTYLRQEIHGRPHNQSLFVSEESYNLIWLSKLQNRAWILSREWDARHILERNS